MGIFEPSIFLAIFPYAFISMFPIFGIVLLTRSLLRRK